MVAEKPLKKIPTPDQNNKENTYTTIKREKLPKTCVKLDDFKHSKKNIGFILET